MVNPPITVRNGQTKEPHMFPPARAQYYASKKLRKALNAKRAKPKTAKYLTKHTGFEGIELYRQLQHFYIIQSFDIQAGHYLFELTSPTAADEMIQPFKAISDV